ncbi:SWPV1-022 [Shearwaterpox virus]|uniref:SWPV1-022 n=1 Tax=Shearwaterpox virus TaxID=1974596 RepID=A0A1V0S7U3_CNPV|nr:SWPV1-022 [Shearwaterpox virus]
MNIHDIAYNDYILEILNGEWQDYLDKNKPYKTVILNGYYSSSIIDGLFDPEFIGIHDILFYDDPIETNKYSFALYFLESGQKRVITLLNATKYECMYTANEAYLTRHNAIYLVVKCCKNN